MSVLCFKNHFILESQDLGDPTTVACNIIKSFFQSFALIVPGFNIMLIIL